MMFGGQSVFRIQTSICSSTTKAEAKARCVKALPKANPPPCAKTNTGAS